MEIYNKTGVTASGLISLEKGVSGFCIHTTVEPQTIANEQISVVIAGLGGERQVTKGFIPLAVFLQLAGFRSQAQTYFGANKTSVKVDICEGGAIILAQREQLRVELKGLNASETYIIDAIEEPIYSDRVRHFERLTMGSEEISKPFYTDEFDLMWIDRLADVENFEFTYDNGNRCKYTMRELDTIMRASDPIAYINSSTAVPYFANGLCVPLVGVTQVDVSKPTVGNVFNVYLRKRV